MHNIYPCEQEKNAQISGLKQELEDTQTNLQQLKLAIEIINLSQWKC